MEYEFDYFISYSHKDNEPKDGVPGFVDEFVNKLHKSKEHQQMFGRELKIFFDKSEIHSMSDWDNRIRSSLAHSRFFVVLLSPNYFQSEYCAREFDWWMQHEMHRHVLKEGAAPMLIVKVDDIYNFDVDPIPAIPPDLQVKFPNWIKQLRQYQSGPDFDLHDLYRAKIDETLRSLCRETKDKFFKQENAGKSPINANYPGYNENFVGRRDELSFLRQSLSTKNTVAISAVSGLGGIGKTELAITYGHAFAWDYRLGRVFANCEDETSLVKVILSCGIASMYNLKLEGNDADQLTMLFNELERKIESIKQDNAEKNIEGTIGTHILLILDNVNRLELVSPEQLRRLKDYFHVIITTRESANKLSYIDTASLNKLSEDESFELLSNLRSFGIDPKEAQAAREIAKLLDGFTLAVEITGAYLRQRPRVTYQKQYEHLRDNLSKAIQTMVNQKPLLQQHQTACISVVLESTLSALSDNARNALKIAAQMSPDAVALGWLPELLGLDEDEGFEVLDELTGYNLLTPLEGEPNIARIHRLVAESLEIQKVEQKEIISKIRVKCDDLLYKDASFWYVPENSWNITPVSEYLKLTAERWNIETIEVEATCYLCWMMVSTGDILKRLGKMKEAFDEYKLYHEMYQKLANSNPDNYQIQNNFGHSCERLGSLEYAAGNISAAWNWYQMALDIAKRLHDLMPEFTEAQRNLGIMSYKFGDLEMSAGNIDAARKLYIEFMNISQALANSMPDNDQIQAEFGSSYERLGFLEQKAGNIKTAKEWYEKALKINQNLVDKNPENTNAQNDLSVAYERLGKIELSVGNIDKAREWYEKDLKIRQQLADKMPENVDMMRNLSVSYEDLGNIARAIGNTNVAWNYHQKALKIRQKLADIMPGKVEILNNLSISYGILGEMEFSAKNTNAARKWFKKCLEIRLELADKMPDDIQVLNDLNLAYSHLGDTERLAKNIDDARKWEDKALEIAQKLTNAKPDNFMAQSCLGETFNKLGDTERLAGNYDAAKKWYINCLDIIQKLAKAAPADVIIQRELSVVFFNLGDTDRRTGNTETAKDWFIKGLDISQKLADAIPEDVQIQSILSSSYRYLGAIEKAAENISAAGEWYEKLLTVCQKQADKMPKNAELKLDLLDSYVSVGYCYDKLGNMEQKAGNSDAARAWFEKLLIISQKINDIKLKNFDSEHSLCIAYMNLGNLEQTVGNIDTAREWYMKALKIHKNQIDKNPKNFKALQYLNTLYNYLGDIEVAAGNIDTAKKWYEKLLETSHIIADKMPGDAKAQQNLFISYYKLGSTYEILGEKEQAAGNIESARKWYLKLQDISQKMTDVMPKNALFPNSSNIIKNKLASLNNSTNNISSFLRYFKWGKKRKE